MIGFILSQIIQSIIPTIFLSLQVALIRKVVITVGMLQYLIFKIKLIHSKAILLFLLIKIISISFSVILK